MGGRPVKSESTVGVKNIAIFLFFNRSKSQEHPLFLYIKKIKISQRPEGAERTDCLWCWVRFSSVKYDKFRTYPPGYHVNISHEYSRFSADFEGTSNFPLP